MIIYREFQFDAAHWQPFEPDYRPNGRMHGHTFNVVVGFEGEKKHTGMVIDYATIDTCLTPLRTELDHHILNDIPGLKTPTNEAIAKWIFEKVNGISGLPYCVSVDVNRKINGMLAGVKYP
jgi:6-pyruvoyltetrahydropterin/6-carboxytetrahydropterin synthase